MPLNRSLCSAPQLANWLGTLFLLVLVLHPGHANPPFSSRRKRDSSDPIAKEFNAYWNVPSFLCNKYKINFEPLLQSFGIKSNPNGDFSGSVINILYDPGMFPVYLKNPLTNEIKALNGGAPHKGDVEEHLKAFAQDVEKVIPTDFDGLGIIDFESWRPVFRQNWNDQYIYKEVLINEIRRKNPTFNDKKVSDMAKKQFENVTREFMEKTLRKAKELRPKAKWGYYGYPYCLNSKSGDNFECYTRVRRENDEILWLFRESTALFPSLYMDERASTEEHVKIMTGRMNEVQRVIRKVSSKNLTSAFPFVWYKYRDTLTFLTKEDIYNTMKTVARYKMGGFIIWGSSKDFTSKSDCEAVRKYIQRTLGPNLVAARENFKNNIFTTKTLQRT